MHIFLAWLASGRLSPRKASRRIAVLAELSELYRAHIAIEDTEVFPVAAEVLSALDREAIGREMGFAAASARECQSHARAESTSTASASSRSA